MTARALEISAGAQFLDPKVLARIESLELLARVVVEGFISGLHRSPHLGLSVDFAEHRAYMPGDDIRRIDWRLYGRTDRHYVKEFEADTNTNVAVLLDVSPSMRYASGDLSKLDYGRYLAACLAYFSHRQRDRVGLGTFAADVVDFVPPSAKHLPVVLHALDRIGTGDWGLGTGLPAQGGAPSGARSSQSPVPSPQSQPEGPLDFPLRKLSEHFRRRSILVLISDLYDEPRRVLGAVGRLRNRGNDLIVMHVLDPAELEFPFEDAASFEDMESGERLPVVPAHLRGQYRALVAGHVAELSRLLGEHGVDYALFDTSRPLDHALFEYLSSRQRLMRVR
jgi:uncharacterized protein (DUF58 family)